ncbi:hypothetical protein FTV88_1325 [Heliorestis convoluta]|uniref:Uncharacterized protein n=1 Tax=Heliorestis convoluta TaxID=356322 RepID=A0A5Q2N2I3_9FIRM|nr:hypothetical protein FTV88_1325 [Heliorestis convoluta]
MSLAQIQIKAEGEVDLPFELWSTFPKGSLVRFSLDQDGNIVMEPITYLRCISNVNKRARRKIRPYKRRKVTGNLLLVKG